MSPLPFLGVSSLMNLAAPPGAAVFLSGRGLGLRVGKRGAQIPRTSRAVVRAPAQRSFEISKYSGERANAS
jgi:hypothetical protein